MQDLQRKSEDNQRPTQKNPTSYYSKSDFGWWKDIMQLTFTVTSRSDILLQKFSFDKNMSIHECYVFIKMVSIIGSENNYS